MEISARLMLQALDSYLQKKTKTEHIPDIPVKQSLEELQYMINVVQRHRFSDKRCYSNRSIFDFYKTFLNVDDAIMMKEKQFSTFKTHQSSRSKDFPDISAHLLPSIQNAVEHFQKTMKRPKELLRLPPLYQTSGDPSRASRLRYKHRSTEELLENSGNLDKLHHILHDEYVANSIDVVSEANNPTKSQTDSIECAPPLVSTSLSDTIALNKALDKKAKKGKELETNEIRFSTNKHNEEIEKEETNVAAEKQSELKNNETEVKKELNETKELIKSIFITVMPDVKPQKKTVRFNLNPNVHKIAYISALKSSKIKEKRPKITESYKFSYFSETNFKSKKKRKKLGMKHIFKGQHPDKFYRTQQ